MTLTFIIISGNNIGGFERRFINLLKYIKTNSTHSVRLVLSEAAQSALLELNMLPIEVEQIVLKDRIFKDFNLLNKLVLLLSLIKYIFVNHYRRGDHIHAVTNPGLLTSVLTCFRTRYSSSIVDSRHEYRWFHLYLLALGARSVDCLSDSIRTHVQNRLGKKSDIRKFRVAPCSFYNRDKIIESADKDIDICFVARDVPGKGRKFLKDIKQKFPELSIFSDYTPDPFPIYSRSKIFLSLQEFENYPSQSLLEAMASGCCVIASNVGETGKLVRSDTGVLVKLESQDVLEAVQFLIENDEVRYALSRKAEDFVSREHTVEKFYEYFREIVA